MIKHIIIFLILWSFFNCTEPYTLETSTFEKALIVEAVLTNELRNHEVKLSWSHKLEDSISGNVNNAQVRIESSDNTTYHFTENNQGIYVSDQEFKALPDKAYKLLITTSEGKQYESREEYLTPATNIQNVYAETGILNGKHGIQVYVDSNNDVGEATYFRYEFEETHKVVTPYEITSDIELTNIDDTPSTFSYDVVVTPTTEEKRVGYVTNTQKEILQTSLVNSSENTINRFPIRFINAVDYILRERYSIVVKQYVQTNDSYDFYKTLKELGSLSSLLTENQSGFVRGNIYSKTNNKENVVGFFDVSSVDKKRIYFSHLDFNINKPDYPYFCTTDTLDYRDNTNIDFDRNDRAILYNSLEIVTPPWELLNIEYIEEEDEEGNLILIPIYILLTPECGNCNSFSSNIKPEFWED